jgi:NADH-quinone oxidoreductase subunit C
MDPIDANQVGDSGDSGELIQRASAAAGSLAVETSTTRGEHTIVVQREGALGFFRKLRSQPDLDFDVLVDLTAVDYLGREPRFEVVYHFLSLARNHRLRVKIRVPENDARVHSLVDLWKSANWMEREVWDFFGIRFDGHPDLRRILMYEEFKGHPLRKDYPFDKRQPLTEERDPIVKDWKF